MNEKPPVDAKDKFGREAMIRVCTIDCIPITKKVVQDIIGKDKLVCERVCRAYKEMTMIKPVIRSY